MSLVVAGIGGAQQAIYYNDAARHSADYAREAKEQIAAECRMMLTKAECARKIIDAARQDQRDEYDLYSQQSMAVWTAIMGMMAVLGVAMSPVGIYLVWTTWKQSAEAAESARTTLRFYVAKERAILKTERAVFSYEKTRRHANGFKVVLANVGAGAAHIKSIGWSYLAQGLNAWPKRMQVTDFTPAVVAADSNWTTYHLGTVEFPSEPFWLVGVIEYRTLDAGDFHCHFCFEARFLDHGGPDDWMAEASTVSGMPRDS